MAGGSSSRRRRQKIRGGDSALKQQAEMALRARLSDQSRPLLVDVGPVWLVAELADAAAVHALAPDMAAIAQLSLDLSIAGITAFGLTGRQPDAVYTRSFAPAFNVPEDPVCGSGNASVGAFLAHFEKLGATGAAYVAHQGNEVGRDGAIMVTVNPEDRSVEIGGHSVTCIEGTLRDRT